MIEGQQTTPNALSTETPTSRYFRRLVPLLAVILICAGALGYWPRHRTEEQIQAAARAESRALPLVPAVTVQTSPPVSEVVLPGSMTGWWSKPISTLARTAI